MPRAWPAAIVVGAAIVPGIAVAATFFGAVSAVVIAFARPVLARAIVSVARSVVFAAGPLRACRLVAET